MHAAFSLPHRLILIPGKCFAQATFIVDRTVDNHVFVLYLYLFCLLATTVNPVNQLYIYAAVSCIH